MSITLPIHIRIKNKQWEITIVSYDNLEIEFCFLNIDTFDKFYQRVPIKAIANFDKIVAKGLGYDT